jgi:hypothetical protein
VGAPEILLPAGTHDEVLGHLLPAEAEHEEAAFAFVAPAKTASVTFAVLEWYAVPPDGFAYRSKYGIELTDATRATVIKRAHDLGASLVELHSHPYPRPAEFSPSDLAGFEEFVPHVWWRLKARPYFALVVAPGSFDALCWMSSPETPGPLGGLRIGHRLLAPTNLTGRGGSTWES